MAPILRILSSYVSRKVRSFSREWRSFDRDVVGSEKVDLDNVGRWSGEDLRRMIFWRLGLEVEFVRGMGWNRSRNFIFGKNILRNIQEMVKYPVSHFVSSINNRICNNFGINY